MWREKTNSSHLGETKLQAAPLTSLLVLLMIRGREMATRPTTMTTTLIQYMTSDLTVQLN